MIVGVSIEDDGIVPYISSEDENSIRYISLIQKKMSKNNRKLCYFFKPTLKIRFLLVVGTLKGGGVG